MTKQLFMRFFILAFTWLISFTVHAELPRRAYLGLQVVDVTDSIAVMHQLPDAAGVYIEAVREDGTGATLNFQKGDVILKVNDEVVESANAFTQLISYHQEGDPVSLEFIRDGERETAEGVMTGFPKETSPYARIIYDQFQFDGGYVRTIIHRPEGNGPHPAVFFVQGYPCASVDNLGEHHPYQKLLEGFSKQGYVVIKTEKAGMGDSRSHTDCADMGLFKEAELFSASYNNLTRYEFIDFDNVFIFGHSMGGIQAPMMQTDFSPRGIIVFGTAVRPWFEYFIEQTRIQRLTLGQDYLENEAKHEQSVRFYYRFMVEQESPKELLNDPEMADFINSYWNYGNGGYFNGRHYSFWHQLQQTKLFKAWSQVDAHVLSVHGQGDFVAFNPYEHELIADIVNHYNPGKATYVSAPNIDHSFIDVKNLDHAVSVLRDAEYRRDNFNYDFINMVTEWMEAVKED